MVKTWFYQVHTSFPGAKDTQFRIGELSIEGAPDS